MSLTAGRAGRADPPKTQDIASLNPQVRPTKPVADGGALGVRSAAPLNPIVRQTSPVRVQTQMRVSSPSDAAEQEAASVGKAVMQMPHQGLDPAPPSIGARSSGVAQREAAHGGERRADPDILAALSRLSSSGSPLPNDMRTFMEPRFRADFSAVRIHTDHDAAKLAAQLGARAFTVGRDIYFAKGEFKPDRREGWELVAHELTHTLQQGGASHAPVAPPRAPAAPKPSAAAPAQPVKAPTAGVSTGTGAAPAKGAPTGAAGASAKPVSAGAPATAAHAPAPPMSAPPARPAPAPRAEAAKAAPELAKPKADIATRKPGAPSAGVEAVATPVVAKPRPAPAPAAPAKAPTVTQKASPSIQRLGLSDALDYFADKANYIPGFRMLTIVLGVNPINMMAVDRSAANVLRAVIEFLPGGAFITQALDNAGVFEKVGAWVGEQISSLAITGAALKQAVMEFLGTLSWSDIFDLGGVWDRAKRIFSEPIGRIIAFVKGLVTGILKFIKDAILLPLAKLAEGTKGWDLLIAVLGKNPITGDAVERSAENLIGGFLKLIGEEETWENMKKANAIPRAWAWFQGAMSALSGFVSQIPSLFKAAFESLTIQDVVLVVGAFQKVASVFGGFIGNFVSWAGNALWDLLKIIFDVVSPGAMEYVLKTGAALKSILKNPLPFVKNLVAAAKLGLTNFADHFGAHLKQSLIDWLTGSLKGVYIPQALTLVELGKFALSVLGISWAQIRGKIVKALGANGETIMKAMETGFDIVVALVKGGVGAAWELIKEKLTNLKDMVVDGIIGFVTDAIIQKAIPKLVSLFVPGAGFISAILSIYDTVKVFIEKLSKIIAVVKAFVDSIVAIAAGQIAGAAGRVESALGDVLTLVISFLANFLGLTNVTEKIMDVVHKVQAYVDKALDTAINFVIGKAKAFIAKLFGKDKKAAPAGTATATVPFSMKGTAHTLTVTYKNGALSVDMASTAGSLSGKIEKLKAPLATKPGLSDQERSGILAKLKELQERLDDSNKVKEAFDKSLGAEGETPVPVPPEFAKTYAQGIIAELVAFAEVFGFTDLLASAFVPNPLPAKRYIREPMLDNIRYQLYERGSAWTSVRSGIAASVGKQIDAEIQSRIVAPNLAGKTSDASAAMNDMKGRGKVLDGASLRDFQPTMSYVSKNSDEYEVDHDPSLAEHWTKLGGNTTTDSARRAVTEGASVTKLDYVTVSFNRSKGSKDSAGDRQGFKKTPWISPPFTSEIGVDIKNQPNNQDLVILGGQSLADDKGTPFLPI